MNSFPNMHRHFYGVFALAGEHTHKIKKTPQGDIHIIPFNIKGLDLVIGVAEKITDRSLLFTYDSIREEILE